MGWSTVVALLFATRFGIGAVLSEFILGVGSSTYFGLPMNWLRVRKGTDCFITTQKD